MILRILHRALLGCVFSLQVVGAAAQTSETVVVEVRGDAGPIAGARVDLGSVTLIAGPDGVAMATIPAGPLTITVVKEGFAPATASFTVTAGAPRRVLITLERQKAFEEEVTVTATRTNKRVEDQPMRVEVVPGDEVQEKIMMAPGDVSMLLNETNGLRVQTTSPSLGGASVRIQGLRGRYTQILADGLPLYGGQTGSIGLLQIAPMDLGQVEIIKGAASALYGMSAIGGVINLVSRRPPQQGHEAELLVNQTTHAGTDVVSWLAAPLGGRWGYTFVGGGHFQQRSDLDQDGWTDLSMYRRVAVRPRLFWDDGRGKSVLVAIGAMAESRRGGTMPGSPAPDGQPYRENLGTTRLDLGVVARTTTSRGVVLAARGSATAQDHTHTFGTVVEADDHQTLFGELSATGTSGRHTWVLGAALQRDGYAARDVPRFDYTHTVPGVFVQDELTPWTPLTLAASARVDRHSEFGTFVSPRLSALLRPAGGWTIRVSGGRGHFAPTPFTDETEATGLSGVAPLGDLEAERADSVSADVTWARTPFEITGTLFHSRIRGALAVRQTGRADLPIAIRNADGLTRTQGTEFIARYHRDELDVILTHMYLWSTEPNPDAAGRREVPLNPRHSATFDVLQEIGPARIGVEVFYTGGQALDENPFRQRGFPHVLFGGLIDWAVGRARIFVNLENAADVRQTREHPLIRPARDPFGRWTVDAWAPLDGRTLNAGIRMRF
ncbi:MAG: TonB-dependent receptor [Acidobacteriota bacterium]|nr:TonB-dependent receptor [Acidobacteriota bacterium]